MQAELNSLGHFPILQFFGGLLVVMGIAFAIWRANRDNKAAPPVPPALVAIGGALADRDTAERMMQTQHEMIKSINRLARCIELTGEEAARRLERLTDSADQHRRAIDDLVDIMRRK